MSKRVESAYGWSNRAQFLFDDGVVSSANNRYYPWTDESRIMLADKALPLKQHHQEIISREHYRQILKTYLLIQDYRDATH